jgi:predicted CXXCH cytochrome family protein
MRMRVLILVIMFIGLFLLKDAHTRSIVYTKHNLSVSGPGTVKATIEVPVCEFCHTPHHAGQAQPLWNKDIPDIVYTTYQSSTLKAAVGQPNGASRLCLSCHDGTIALGLVRSRTQPIPFSGGVTTMPAGRTRLGTDLSDDHPISFVYDSSLVSRNGQLEQPANLRGPVKLDRFSQVQCTSCHNPHDDQYAKFLVMSNTATALCTTCHKKDYWSQTTHRTSTRTWNGAGANPWPRTPYTTVSANGCENCHQPHTAGGRERLLNYAVEESNCYPCHNGNVTTKNIQQEFSKAYVHPIATNTGVHKAGENPLWATRHVECVDCHNPHASNASTASPPLASGRLAGAVGISSSGTTVNPLTYEYQLCYRCHADNPGTQAPVVSRVIAEKNLRQKFKTSNASYHPVEAAGKNPDGPSLIVPYTVSSLTYCTQCHNNNAGPGAGGAGPNGPHGSIYRPILERQYTTTDNTPESSAQYALCYKCHSRTSILGNQSFKDHNKHIVGERTPCSVCHDPHGVASSTHLINFDKTVVTPSSSGILRFDDLGRFSGRCYLTCHGENHNPLSYSR